MKPSILKKSDGSKLAIGVRALTRMLVCIQDTPRKKEAGGVLLGRHILDSPDIVIDEITIPIREDRRGRLYFYRDRNPHQRAIDRAWRESGGTCTYLGEWHTHPEGHPTPSVLDLRGWRRKLREDMFAGDALYFVIVGTESLRVWEGDRRSSECWLIGEFAHYGGQDAKAAEAEEHSR